MAYTVAQARQALTVLLPTVYSCYDSPEEADEATLVFRLSSSLRGSGYMAEAEAFLEVTARDSRFSVDFETTAASNMFLEALEAL